MSNEHTTEGELSIGLAQLTRLARSSLGRMTPEQSLRGELAVAERVPLARAGRPLWLIPSAAAVLAGIALASVLVVRHQMRPAALSYVIENGASADDRSLDVE